MQYILTGNFRDDIHFLKDADKNVVQEFFEMSLKFMNVEHINTKIYTSVANKLNTSSTKIEYCIRALMYLITQISKYRMTSNDLKAYIGEFDKTSMEALLETIEENRQRLYTLCRMKVIPISFPMYQNLNWRIQYKMASRSCYDQCSPEIVLHLVTKSKENNTSDDISVHNIVSDIANVKHLKEELSKALQMLKSRKTLKLINS